MAGKLSALFEAQDMTQGSPTKNLIRFSVPLLIGNMAQQLYSTVDSIVVGNYVGDGALAAIGASNPVINLLLVLFMGVSVGASVMASQYFGAKERDSLSATIGTTITATFVTSVFIMVVGPLITHPVMRLLDTPQEIYDMACGYLIILFLGILGSAYYNIISGVLRGLGDSIMPLVFLLVACFLNIGLDVWFVAGLKMGVAGAAWATIISQLISGILCMVRLLRMRDVFDVSWRGLWPKSAYVNRLVRLGLPSGLTQAIFSFAMIIIQSLTNSFGASVLAANTVVMRVDGFAMMPNFTFGSAMTTYTGQNMGAGRLDRTEKGAKAGMLMGLGVSVVLVGLILIFGKYLMLMFTSTPAVIDLGQRMLNTLAIGYIAMAVTQILSGVMRGAGDTMTPMWISVITTVVIRVPVAYGLEFLTRPAGGAMGSGTPDPLFLSLVISWVAGAVLTVIAYARGGWKKKAITKAAGGKE
ncbi:MATE family efflux transporter [Acutalibacter caecimuris]|uniref:MATE family efflux transporter n=1 Tax=Acutalibacter caecimuris TaxID=3093657 RepID=UPI002AC89F63|nr:MATE family efflux transporter [Acutalibacter sp. M00118]